MTTITLKNVPATIHRAIKRRAEHNRRSINSEILLCLEKILGLSPDESKELLLQVEVAHKGLNFKISQAEIKKAIVEGRE